MKHNFIVIIGRRPHYENECMLFENMTVAQAKKMFDKELYACAERGDRKRCIENEGSAIYIDHILTSESRIVIEPTR